MSTISNREEIARIIAPRLYGNPFDYPDGIESDDCLTAARNAALAKADAILALCARPMVAEDRGGAS